MTTTKTTTLATTQAAREALGDVVTAALDLAQALDRANDVQWLPAPILRAHTDTAERSRGVASDPVLDTVTDVRRLAVREAVEEAMRALRLQAAYLVRLTRHVDTAVERWEGVGPNE
jgi:hypothetical protein